MSRDPYVTRVCVAPTPHSELNTQRSHFVQPPVQGHGAPLTYQATAYQVGHTLIPYGVSIT